MTKEQKTAIGFVFVDYCMFVTLTGRYNAVSDEDHSRIFGDLMAANIGRLIEAGLSKEQAIEAIEKFPAWLKERSFSIQFVFLNGEPPTCDLNFVDELDQDPEFLAMKEALSRPSTS